jgi:hypothetical protein
MVKPSVLSTISIFIQLFVDVRGLLVDAQGHALAQRLHTRVKRSEQGADRKEFCRLNDSSRRTFVVFRNPATRRSGL